MASKHVTRQVCYVFAPSVDRGHAGARVQIEFVIRIKSPEQTQILGSCASEIASKGRPQASVSLAQTRKPGRIAPDEVFLLRRQVDDILVSEHRRAAIRSRAFNPFKQRPTRCPAGQATSASMTLTSATGVSSASGRFWSRLGLAAGGRCPSRNSCRRSIVRSLAERHWLSRKFREARAFVEGDKPSLAAFDFILGR